MPLDNATTELVAIGASIAANCQSCVEYHVRKARDAGIDRQQIAQAIDVGRTVRQGAATKTDNVAAGLLDGAPAPTETGGQPRRGCGCGWTA